MQAPADVQTPLWGNSASANEDKISGGDADGNRSGAVGDDGQEIGADGSDKKGKADEGAQPKTWRGVGTFQVHTYFTPSCCTLMDAVAAKFYERPLGRCKAFLRVNMRFVFTCTVQTES